MSGNKADPGEVSVKGNSNSVEEDFLSLEEPERKHTAHDAVEDDNEDEDFISLTPANEEEEEDDEEGDSNNDGSDADDSGNKMESNRNGGLPPWMQHQVDYRRVNPLVALHNEIVAFCRLMEPREEEMKTREDLVEKFTALIKSVFPNCEVDVFGSQATG